MTPDSKRTVAEFDYYLPPELIAQEPLAERDGSRLLVVDRTTGELIHESIASLPRLLRPSDLIVVNNTRVLPARLFGTKIRTGGKVELLLLHRDPSGLWTCLARPAKSLKPEVEILVSSQIGNGNSLIRVVDRLDDGIVRFEFLDGAGEQLEQLGITPLPPYIHAELQDAERYQTVYASFPGSAAAPTAGLHITDRLRGALQARGIGWVEVTLHIGLDTFRPVTVEHIDDHQIHREWCSLTSEVAGRLASTRKSGGRVVAVGTTTARTLEMWAKEGMSPEGFTGWADLFITPGYDWKTVDAMVTNFHLPRSTLVMMVGAFAGVDTVRRAYCEAIANGYRFYSFGDAMLIL